MEDGVVETVDKAPETVAGTSTIVDWVVTVDVDMISLGIVVTVKIGKESIESVLIDFVAVAMSRLVDGNEGERKALVPKGPCCDESDTGPREVKAKQYLHGYTQCLITKEEQL